MIVARKDAKPVEKKTCLILALSYSSLCRAVKKRIGLSPQTGRGCNASEKSIDTDHLFCTVNVRYCSIYYDP
jgi:hypothetical protein